MLYLETPIGVGFSYSAATSSYETVTDEITGVYFFCKGINQMYLFPFIIFISSKSELIIYNKTKD